MKTFTTTLIAFFMVLNLTSAQDTLYIYKSGIVVSTLPTAQIDSIIFYKATGNNPEDSTVTDVDSNVYKTITIGTQTWMVENLRTTKYNDGTTIPNVTDAADWKDIFTDGMCTYDNNSNVDTLYGRLYNWYAVNTGKLAPTGWHVPTDAEWATLENYLIANGYNYDGTTTGNKIAKALASKTGWQTSTSGGAVGNTDYKAKRNASGFTATPAGYRVYNGAFLNLNLISVWWSATGFNEGNSWGRRFSYNSNSVERNMDGKSNGFSVRCVKD
jgi:uncharacterized protein (TIGR02145 family)